MTHTMKIQMLALGAAVAVAGILGPETLATTRLGAASEVTGFATVSAADTITSTDVLAEVAAEISRR